jgi:hypothetical protein
MRSTPAPQCVDQAPEGGIVHLHSVQDRASGLDRLDLTEVLKQIKRYGACDSDLVRGLSHVRIDPRIVNVATMPDIGLGDFTRFG